MDRLIAPNSVDADHADTAPATGTPGYATDGNPATGVPATLWPSYQYNAFQEELIALIVEAGLTPSNTTNTQVRDAVLALFAKINGDATETFSVAPATASQHAVQFGQFLGTLSGSGQVTIPCIASGVARNLIVKWGQASGQSTYSITFPSAFPNACLWAGASTNGGGGTAAAYCEVNTPTATGIGIFALQSGGAGSSQPQLRAVLWIAIGW